MSGVGHGPCASDEIKYNAQGYTRGMWKQQSTNSSSVEVCRVRWGAVAVLTYLTLNT